jgi:hypothetical protein
MTLPPPDEPQGRGDEQGERSERVSYPIACCVGLAVSLAVWSLIVWLVWYVRG